MTGGALDPTDPIGGFTHLIAYDDWANREALGSLTRSGEPPGKAVSLLAHIVAAQDLWLERMRPTGAEVAVWPATSLGEIEAALDATRSRWRRFFADLGVDRLADSALYVNSKGEPWQSRVADILMHLVVHGGYHRGQIALLLRGHGAEPAYTDYIHCVRAGLLADVGEAPPVD